MKRRKQVKAWEPLKGALAEELVARTFRRYLRQVISVVHSARLAGPFRNSKRGPEEALKHSKWLAVQRLGSFVAVLHAYYRHATDIPGPWTASWRKVEDCYRSFLFDSEEEAMAVKDALNRLVLSQKPLPERP